MPHYVINYCIFLEEEEAAENALRRSNRPCLPVFRAPVAFSVVSVLDSLAFSHGVRVLRRVEGFNTKKCELGRLYLLVERDV